MPRFLAAKVKNGSTDSFLLFLLLFSEKKEAFLCSFGEATFFPEAVPLTTSNLLTLIHQRQALLPPMWHELILARLRIPIGDYGQPPSYIAEAVILFYFVE